MNRRVWLAPHVSVKEGEGSDHCPSVAHHLPKHLEDADAGDAYDDADADDADYSDE